MSSASRKIFIHVDTNCLVSQNKTYDMRVISLAYIITQDFKPVKIVHRLINVPDIEISPEAKKIHQITRENLHRNGESDDDVYAEFCKNLQLDDEIVAANQFHIQCLMEELDFININNPLKDSKKTSIRDMFFSKPIGKNRQYEKGLTMIKMYYELFGVEIDTDSNVNIIKKYIQMYKELSV